jgi:hypothetical protein
MVHGSSASVSAGRSLLAYPTATTGRAVIISSQSTFRVLIFRHLVVALGWIVSFAAVVDGDDLTAMVKGPHRQPTLHF